MISQAVNNEIVGQDTARAQAFPTVGMVRENLVQIIWRSRWIVLATMIVSLAAAFILMMLLAFSPSRKTESLILIES